MGIFSHNVYENIRTRVIVLHERNLLLLEPYEPGAGWQVPGGGLELNESLAECCTREVFEETGIIVEVTRVAFLREWVVPKYTTALEPGEGTGFGLEIYFYAYPLTEQLEPRIERFNGQKPHWIPLARVPDLPLWPRELKTL